MYKRIKFWNVLMIAALVAGAVFVTPARPVQAANALRISQVFGAGGSTGSPYTHDFVEIFNSGTTAISLNGMSIQYASSTGTGNFGATATQLTELPNVMLQPGQYYLIQGSSGTNGSPLPTPDVIDATPIALSQTAGKVIIATQATSIGCNGGSTPCTIEQLALIVDLVGYGSATNFFEGSPVPDLSATTAAIRLASGCTDTDVNSADFTRGTPTPRNSSSPVHSCSADSAPAVQSTTPANSATGVALTANIDITFTETVNAAAGWYSISCGTSGAHTAAVSGGPTTFTLNPDADFVNSETCTVTVTAANITDQDANDPPDTMAANFNFSFTAVSASACGLPFTAIHDIQGSLDAPALTGVQTIEGVVTADYQGGGFNGFYLQAPSGTEDTDPATSEGVFAYNTSFPVNSGDRVRLTGTVTNYTGGGFSNMTEITTLTALEVCSTGNSVTPTTINLPENADSATYLERFEGMLVTFPESLVVQQNYFQGRYGQLTLGDGRQFQINNFSMGGNPNPQLSMVVLDDGATAQNPGPIPYLAVDGAVRAGNTTTGGLTGVLDNGVINTSTSATAWPLAYYRLQPLSPAGVTFDPLVNARSTTPPVVGGRLTIAAANVLNYFTTLDMEPYRSTSPYDGGSNTPRGADSAVEFTRQQDKIVAMLAGLDADVISLMEIESWDGAAAPQALVTALNTYLAGLGRTDTYAVVADPANGTFDPLDSGDYIQVAMIYRIQTVAPVGSSISTDDTIFSRSPLAQEFEELATGEEFVVVANHLKSKTCTNATGLDLDQGDGQGCYNYLRQQQAAALLTFINTSLVPLDPDVLVMGDLNSYGAEDPITVLTTGGLVNQMAANVPAAERYSYVFDGTAGYLDHALSTASVTSQLTDAAFWHINADEPAVIDYNTEFKTVDLYQPHAFRASDHDPVLLGLNLSTVNVAPVAVEDTYSTDEDVTLTVAAPGVLGNDTDGNGNTLTAVLVTDVLPAQGTLTLNANGSFTFVPALNFSGEVTFTYKANDGLLDSNTVTVTITVNPVNDEPQAVDDFYTVMESYTLGVDAVLGVLANDVEVDGDGLSVSIVTTTAHGTLSLWADGSFIYHPNPGFYGVDTFVYELTTYPDPNKGPWTDQATVTITVTPLFRMWMPVITR